MNTDYKKLNSEDIDFLHSVCGAERVFCGDDISEDYWHDELGGVKNPPEALVKILSTQEVSKIMAYAYEKNIPVTPRGPGW